MKKILISLLVLCSYHLFGATLTGIVYSDVNSNGLRDKNEPAIPGVAVSDQVSVVVTDSNGTYQFTNVQGFGIIFISVPDGYKAKSFYQRVDLTKLPASLDFALAKSGGVTQFKFIHASDTHMDSKSLERTKKFKILVDSVKPDFVLVTGDLIRDALRVPEGVATSLYEMYNTEMQKFSSAVWSVPGNHEIFGIERQLSLVSPQHPLYGRKMYRHYLGPDYYSFNYGGIHFIALNSLEFEDLWYYGSIDSVQREWLKKDLEVISATTPVVTFQHVPFFSAEMSISGYEEEGPGRSLERVKGVKQYRHVVSNAHDLMTILRSRPYPLALGGHHHFRQRLFLENEGQQTRFEQAAAVLGPSGGGWLKVPSGVTVYQVKGGKIDEGTFVKIR